MSLTLAYLMWLIELYRNSGNFRWYKILSKKISTHLIFVVLIIDENLLCYHLQLYRWLELQLHVTLLHQWKSQCQLASYFHYPLISGMLDLAETCPTRGPTENQSEDQLLECRPFISPQHFWLSHLFGTNYQERAIMRTRDWY